MKLFLRRSGLLRLFSILLFFVGGVASYSQDQALKLSSNTIDFGRIAAIVYPAKTVEFTNVGADKLAILLVEKGPNVKVNFQRKFYQPGEKGIISFYYEARDLGEFSEDVKVYTNLDTEPIIITLKGTCISVQECFPNIHNLTLRNVLVINKNTQAPVPMAVLTLIHNHNTQKPFNLKMDKNGKAVEELPIGLYSISSVMSGFEPYTNDLFIPKTYPNVVVELTPKQPAPEALPSIAEPKPAKTTNVIVTSPDLPEDQYAANNIVLLLDVSGSMHSQGKLGLLQLSINNLAMVLRPIDFVTIITYATDAKVVLAGVPGNEKDKIINVVQELVPHGSTQGVKGLNLAYEMAVKDFIKGGNNQVILATDGEFSERNVTDEYYQQFISGYSGKGIKLSILGFGVNKMAEERMKKMTAAGRGSYIHVDSEQYIKDVLIKEIKSMSFMENSISR